MSFRKDYDSFSETRSQIRHSMHLAGDQEHARKRSRLFLKKIGNINIIIARTLSPSQHPKSGSLGGSGGESIRLSWSRSRSLEGTLKIPHRGLPESPDRKRFVPGNIW